MNEFNTEIANRPQKGQDDTVWGELGEYELPQFLSDEITTLRQNLVIWSRSNQNVLEFVSKAFDQGQNALGMFQNEARWILTGTAVLLGAIAGLDGLTLEVLKEVHTGPSVKVLLLSTSTVLSLLGAIKVYLAGTILRNYYGIYAASMVNYALLARAAGVESNPWSQFVFRGIHRIVRNDPELQIRGTDDTGLPTHHHQKMWESWACSKTSTLVRYAKAMKWIFGAFVFSAGIHIVWLAASRTLLVQ